MMAEDWCSSLLKGIYVARVTRSQDGVEVKSMISLVLVKKDMIRYVKNVRTVRGMG